jgi:hypothetical protein
MWLPFIDLLHANYTDNLALIITATVAEQTPIVMLIPMEISLSKRLLRKSAKYSSDFDVEINTVWPFADFPEPFVYLFTFLIPVALA